MIAFTDVHYFETYARAAAAVATDWSSDHPSRVVTVKQPAPNDYQPGQFYKRELPPLLALLDQIDEPIETIVVDGYCTLSEDGAAGLGAYLYEAIHARIAVVGIAKNRFRCTTHAIEVKRGESKNPLYVTAVGMDLDFAARQVRDMAGPHRIPTLLKRVDRAARHGEKPRP
jgi:deoxyribonuclease V